MSRENVEVVRELIRAFNTRNIQAMLAAAHPDAEIVAARSAIAGVYRGHDGVRRWATELFEMTDFYELHTEDLREIGDRVVVLGRQSGRGRPSGAPIEAALAAVIGFGEGQIIRIEVYPTHAEALEAVGLRE